ncbi:MAG: DUF1638 domain-containing protein [Chloroflexota bacterium]|nr:DUF1638 domain-containing protein [Chloroflexota bacterium]
MRRQPASPSPEGRTLFIACAALGRDVKAIVSKHGWDADVQTINAKLHLYPKRIEQAVEKRLAETAGGYARRVVVYGHCGAFNLDATIARAGAVRPLGPHCYEMYGGERFAKALQEEPGTYVLTDFLVRAWGALVVQGLKIDRHPKLKPLLFHRYRKLVYFSQEQDQSLVERAGEIARWLGLPLRIEHVGYGDLERRLVAIIEGREQPTSAMTCDGCGAGAYPIAG